MVAVPDFSENSLEPFGDLEAMAIDLDDTHAMETDKENRGFERYIIGGEKEQWCLSTLGYFKAFSRQYAFEDTVEERMQQVQARKQLMIAGALTDEEVRSARLEELKMLFR
nr:putative SWI/SNF-related matrix-associated actin-dependent regulator of chromatin subfamily A member 3-like 3 [Tanacetum cinerariifolium]